MADERGQGLVEYALIIALVSLAAIAALGFLSGEINDLFRKTGNVLNNVEATGGRGGGGPWPTPPADGTAGSSFPTSEQRRWPVVQHRLRGELRGLERPAACAGL